MIGVVERPNKKRKKKRAKLTVIGTHRTTKCFVPWRVNQITDFFFLVEYLSKTYKRSQVKMSRT